MVHEKFTRSLVNSDEDKQSKFVSLNMPESGDNDNLGYGEVDYSAYGYHDTEDCVKTIMKQFQEMKDEYRKKGLDIKIKELSPFLTRAYYEVLGFESMEDIFN